MTEVDNTTTSTTGAQQIPEIRIEDLSMDTEDVIDSEKVKKMPCCPAVQTDLYALSIDYKTACKKEEGPRESTAAATLRHGQLS